MPPTVQTSFDSLANLHQRNVLGRPSLLVRSVMVPVWRSATRKTVAEPGPATRIATLLPLGEIDMPSTLSRATKTLACSAKEAADAAALNASADTPIKNLRIHSPHQLRSHRDPNRLAL